MPPHRITFWGLPESIGPAFVYLLMGCATLIFIYRLFNRARLWWQLGLPEKRWNQPLKRLWRVIQYAIIQVRLFRKTSSGILHAGLAWSFFIFFLGTALATLHGDFPGLKDELLVGNFYLLYELVLDLFTICFLGTLLLVAYRRFISRPSRLTFSPGFSWSLILLFSIALSGIIVESFRLAIQQPEWAPWSPFGWVLAKIWLGTGITEAWLFTCFYIFYSIHTILVAGTLVILPSTPLFHMMTAPANVFFSQLDRPLGQLAAIPETNKDEMLLGGTLTGMTWSQLLNGDTCTECGRCQESCPAFISGSSLNPKQLILNLRKAIHRDGPVLVKDKAKPVTNLQQTNNSLLVDEISEDVIWSCTSCGACVIECPVLIDHVDAIMSMRRYLVNEGRVDNLLQETLLSIGRYGNSFGQSEHNRAIWVKNTGFKIKDAREESVEYLWFVGDYASYNPTLKEITLKTAQVFQQAQVDFGLLYESERNDGNDVRRVGEEGLFQFLVEKNSVALEKCNFKAIVTTDPHTFNTLKNEYPQHIIKGKPVLHYTQLLEQLMVGGKLKLTKKLGYKVTYHDPCYLGRYNNIYNPPRRILQYLGCKLFEMPRSHDRSFCCNAGGGRIWMEEKPGIERPSENRIREAIALKEGVSHFVVACPKDISMYQEAVKSTFNERRIVVKDMIELIYEAM